MMLLEEDMDLAKLEIQHTQKKIAQHTNRGKSGEAHVQKLNADQRKNKQAYKAAKAKLDEIKIVKADFEKKYPNGKATSATTKARYPPFMIRS